MTSLVAPVPMRSRVGDTVWVDRRPGLVLHLLPRLAGRPLAARVTCDPPCRLCQAPLRWLRSGWCCSACSDVPDSESLAAWCREHVRDGVRAGSTRRNHPSRARQVARGAPGAAAVLLRAAEHGGALSRSALLAAVTGPERRALGWALRDAGDDPLSPERCRAAAAELARTT